MLKILKIVLLKTFGATVHGISVQHALLFMGAKAEIMLRSCSVTVLHAMYELHP